jgi:hypothetical protein
MEGVFLLLGGSLIATLAGTGFLVGPLTNSWRRSNVTSADVHQQNP